VLLQLNLHAISAVVLLGSISAAAQDVGITQPAITQALTTRQAAFASQIEQTVLVL
jgi:DNA-binding transcriptional LysR family regulator